MAADAGRAAAAIGAAAGLVASILVCALLLWLAFHIYAAIFKAIANVAFTILHPSALASYAAGLASAIPAATAAAWSTVVAWSLPAVPWGTWTATGITALAFVGGSVIAQVLVLTVVTIRHYVTRIRRLDGNALRFENINIDEKDIDALGLLPYVASVQGVISFVLLRISLAHYDPLSHGLFAAPLRPVSAWLPAPIAAVVALMVFQAALAIFGHHLQLRKLGKDRCAI